MVGLLYTHSPSLTELRHGNINHFDQVNVIDTISRQILEERVNGLSLCQCSRWWPHYQPDPGVKDGMKQTSQVTCNGGIPSVRDKPLLFWSSLLLQHNLPYPGLVENIVLAGKKSAILHRVV